MDLKGPDRAFEDPENSSAFYIKSEEPGNRSTLFYTSMASENSRSHFK